MKATLSIMTLAATLALAFAVDEQPAVVRFSNKDQLSGKVESLTTDRLVWESPILEKATPFFLKNILDLKLTPVWPTTDARHEATLSLTNGDSVRGQLAAISDDAVELDTWFAGRLKFSRPMISEIRIDERQQVIYQGPSGLDGWIQTEKPPGWTYKDSSLRVNSASGIARDVDLPAECLLAFDLAWRGNFGLKVILFSDDLKKESPTSGYTMTLIARRVMLQNNKNQMQIGRPLMAVELQENEKAHVEIRASSKTGLVSLSIDGKAFPAWKDPDFAASIFGRGIHFITTNNTPVRISDIKVSAWDGMAEEVPAQVNGFRMRQFGGLDVQENEKPAEEEESEKGRMLLRNGDSLEGVVTSIQGDMITINTPLKEVHLPIERLKSVALKPVDPERCKRENGDVRGWFPDGSSMVFRLDAVGDGVLSGSNQNFGSAQFKMAAFSRIEFNIYDPNFEDLRNTSGW